MNGNRKSNASAAVRSLRKEQARERSKSNAEKEAELVEGLKDSFPASDPVAATGSTTAGKAPRER